MSLSKYPPLIDGKIPAFSVVRDETTPTIITVPYVLNKAVSHNDFTQMVIRIKAVTSGDVKLQVATDSCKLQNAATGSMYATFNIPKDVTGEDKTTELSTFTPTTGNYYKIQVAFKKDTEQSPWSSVGIAKCTATPTLSISSLQYEIDNVNPNIYIGTYENLDVTEKLYSYKFTVYDDKDNIYETSGNLIHNGSTDENISGIGVRSLLQWRPQKALTKNKRYRVGLSIETINGYLKTTGTYNVKAGSTIDANIPAHLLATPDYNNGRVHLSLIKKANLKEEIPFTGNFVITRYDESKNTWNEICRFNMLSQSPSDVGILWTDYTISHGDRYLYALQAYNSNELYSNKSYHVLINPNTDSSKPYLDFDEFGDPYYIVGDFEDMFLTDGDRQLKIRFDPKVSTYKPTILESKVETIGSKYPFIFRNGSVNYKEFAISGLLSHLIDEDELFMQGIQPPENTIKRSDTPAATGSESRKDWVRSVQAGSHLSSDSFFRERQFKTSVLDWLTNGRPKLFRSASEGSYIVQLMNTSLAPNETLGRMLHTFSSTAYEIADCNFDNLVKYNLLTPGQVENRPMKFRTINLYDSSNSRHQYTPGYNMYHVHITNATPGTKYYLYFGDIENNDISEAPVEYEIGFTGSLYLDTDIYPVISIQLISGDYNHSAVLHYGYYDESVPDHFSYISNIITDNTSNQVIGTLDINKNIITSDLEDIRTRTGSFYSVVIRPRPIKTIYFSNGQYYRDNKHINIITGGWSDLDIYYEGHSGIYYSGSPFKNNRLGSKLPNQYFKFNDTYILDLSTGNAYLSSDEMQNVLKPNPQAQKCFVSFTNGSYQIVGDFGEIRSINLSPGVYIEVAYEQKIIEYTVEALTREELELRQQWIDKTADYEANQTAENQVAMTEAWNNYYSGLTEVKQAKEDWLISKQAWQNNPTTDMYDDMIAKYAIYTAALEEAISLSYNEEGYYVL